MAAAKLVRATFMNIKIHLIIAGAGLLLGISASGQGTFQYDQQSATNVGIANGDAGLLITASQPMGQSFTPTNSSVGFVQFKFADSHSGNGTGATIYVNLVSDSITGAVLAASAPVFMPDGFFWSITNFFFSTPVSVTPGTTYYFQPVVAAGSDSQWDMVVGNYSYSGGTAFIFGGPQSYQTWFREGARPGTFVDALVLRRYSSLSCLSMAQKEISIQHPNRLAPLTKSDQRNCWSNPKKRKTPMNKNAVICIAVLTLALGAGTDHKAQAASTYQPPTYEIGLEVDSPPLRGTP
jgi:hypothetical protein